jgi:hypothetical protein
MRFSRSRGHGLCRPWLLVLKRGRLRVTVDVARPLEEGDGGLRLVHVKHDGGLAERFRRGGAYGDHVNSAA